MDTVLLGAQFLLAAVFVAAGVGKLLDRAGSRSALADFGVPERAVSLVAWALPLAELGAAAALVIHPSARWGAIAALALLLAFIGGIARALAAGQAPDCHCFGQLHSAPAGRGTLTRNAALALLAAFIAWRGPGTPVDDWVAARTAAELVAVGSSIAAVLLAALALRQWLAARTMRRELDEARAEVLALPPGLPVGFDAPSFALETLDGDPLTLESLRARGRPIALMFMSPGCGGCKPLLPDLGRWQATLADRLTIAVVTTGPAADNRPPFEEHGIADVILQEGAEVMNDYRVDATPTAVAVTSDGKIASAPAAGATTIEPLVRLMLRRAETPPSALPAAAAERSRAT